MAVVAQLFADRTRAAVVAALLDGRALTAGELARAVEVSAPTVSAHLSRLLAAGLVAVETQRRHRYYRLRRARCPRLRGPRRPGAGAAGALAWPIAGDRRAGLGQNLLHHLAGAVAVSLADTLIQRQVLTETDSSYQLGPQGHVLERFGLFLQW